MARSDGFGVGLRVPHYDQLVTDGLDAGLAEAVTENFVGRGGRPRAVLDRVRRDSEVFLHGVSLSIGGLDALNLDYLGQVRELANELEATFVSDHLCFGTRDGHYAHDLWPLPYTEECLTHVVNRISQAQEVIGRQLVLENVSSYVEYRSSEMSEWEFIAAVARQADCLLLCDVNNVHVNAYNHGFVATDFLDAIPGERIAYVHLAGHSDLGEFLLDDHGSAIPDGVLALYEHLLRRIGAVPTIVEWDERIPSLERLLEERDRARAAAERVVTRVGDEPIRVAAGRGKASRAAA